MGVVSGSFRGPETDAFFADMSQFTGSNKMYEAGFLNPAVADRIWTHINANLKLAVTSRYDPRPPSLKGASKGGFSKGLRRGGFEGAWSPLREGSSPFSFLVWSPLEASLRRKREGLLEAPLHERREASLLEASFEKGGSNFSFLAKGRLREGSFSKGASRRRASRRGLREGGLFEGGFEKEGFSKVASRRGTSRRGLREGGLLEKGGFSKGASRRGASRRALREGGLLEGGFEKGAFSKAASRRGARR